MSCSFYKQLSPYLDGELDSPSAEKIKGHLETCAFCSREFDHMLQIRNTLRQEAASTKAPPLLKEKILNARRQRGRWVLIPRWNFAPAAGLVALVLVAFLFYYWPREKAPFTDVVGNLVKHHAAYESGVKSLSTKQTVLQNPESWFENKLGFKTPIPNAAFAGYSLRGVDIFEQQGTKFAYLKYQGNDESIGYIIFKEFTFPIDLPETVDVGEIKLQMGEEKGTNFAVWKKRGLIYFIMTDEDRNSLLEYARRCIDLF